MQPQPQKLLIQKNLLNSIHLAVGTKLFQHLYALDEKGQEIDLLQTGKLSCGVVVSSLLIVHGLVASTHSTVSGTIRDLLTSGWTKTDNPIPGSVVHWPANGNGHEHIGFYLDGQTTMSNSTEQGAPVLHGLNMPDGRGPIAFYTHPKLSQ